MNLTLPLPPPINRYWRTIVRGKHAMPILSSEARSYKARMASIAAEGRMFDRAAGPITGPCVLVVRFFRPRRAGDVDGRIKPLLDALQGLAFANDSQLVAVLAINDHSPENPRAEVQVWPVASPEARCALSDGVAATLSQPSGEVGLESRPIAARTIPIVGK